MENYYSINKKAWNERTSVHLKSEFYDLTSLKMGKTSLPSLDIALLGDISGKSILHLQCHFGMDTLSMSRMNARTVGADFSETAISAANSLSKELKTDTKFYCCDLYEVPNVIEQQFDIVYTSYGVINWLPDLPRWGRAISKMLKKGVHFVMVEFHPVLWMFNEDFSHIVYPYCRAEPFIMEEPSYTDNGGDVVNKTVTWNYGLSEPLMSLIDNGIVITDFKEHFYSPFNLFGTMTEADTDKFVLKGDNVIPITYSVVGNKL